MALTESTMMALNSQAPNFSLPSTDGNTVSLSDFEGADALVVLFICNHCPYVVHIAAALRTLAEEFSARNVAFVAINSNDSVAYPADSFEQMGLEKAKRGYHFPYLFDESQQVALAYDAVCTPDLYVFNSSQRLVYRGQFDESRPHRISSGNYDSSNSPASGASLAAALNEVLAGQIPGGTQVPSMGCSIKWKAGNAP